MGLGAHVAFAFHSERKLRHDLVRRGLHNQEGIVLTHQVIEGLHLRALGVESLPDRLESFGRGLHVLDTLMRVAGQNHECCHSCLPPKQGSSQTVTDRGCLRTLRWSRPARTVAVSQNLMGWTAPRFDNGLKGPRWYAAPSTTEKRGGSDHASYNCRDRSGKERVPASRLRCEGKDSVDCRDLGFEVPWTMRRANLEVGGIDLRDSVEREGVGVHRSWVFRAQAVG